MNDYKKFCLKCNWLDSDRGCYVPAYEEVWQCPMYIHYHPEEVKKFNNDCITWLLAGSKNNKST